ncbi:MAG: hypothetical protein AAF125_22605, partial [Chloroflexota bacterium]
VGNDPARRMFQKFGFEDYRELLVIRRPPKPHVPGTHPLVYELRQLTDAEIIECLAEREEGASWVEETASVVNAGSLKGLRVQMGEDSQGWAVFRCTRFQIQHIVMCATGDLSDEVFHALLYYIHELYPNRDTKVENVPTDHPTWAAYQRLQYVVAFRRTEMLLKL